MKAIILAAGYSRRLYPHIRDIPKPLLSIAGTPLIELTLEKMKNIPEIKGVLILVNELHRRRFDDWAEDWAPDHPMPMPITIHSDGTTSYFQSKGVLGNLRLAAQKVGTNTDLLVIAGDNFFEFDFDDLLNSYTKSRCLALIAVHDLGDPRKLAGRFGVVEIDDDKRVTGFQEKPANPRSSLASALCYVLSPQAFGMLDTYLTEGHSPDAAGLFIKYLVDKGHHVLAHLFSERWFDIGHVDEYRALNQTELHKRLLAKPTFSQPVDAVILFADMIGSAMISEFSSEDEYDRFISEFQTNAQSAIDDNLRSYGYSREDRYFCESSVSGDQAVLILYTKDPERDAEAAISTAIELKRKCFLSKFNRRRKGRALYDVGIAIHYGRVVLKQHPSATYTDKKFNAEGYAINLTKRIEGFSREGRFSKIILSDSVKDMVSFPILLSERIDVPLRGIYGSRAVYELRVYGNVGDPENTYKIDPKEIDYYEAALQSSSYDMWLLLSVARYYYDEEDYATANKHYLEAIKLYADFAAAYAFLGRSLYREGRFKEAEQHLSKALDLNPSSSRINNYLAVTRRRLGKYDVALEHHENAVSAEPRFGFAHNAFAYTIAEAHPDKVQGDRYTLDVATKHLENARLCFDKKERERLAYIFQHTEGFIHLKGKSYGDAEGCFRRALRVIEANLEMKPRKRAEKKGELLYHLGYTLYVKGKGYWKEAQEYLENAIAMLTLPYIGQIGAYWLGDAQGIIKQMTS